MEKSIQYIRELDLEYLVKRLVDQENWSPHEAREAVRRYKNFLILVCKYPSATVPAEDIDEVWHAHILHTQRYMRDCHEIWGKYLHHSPIIGAEEEQSQLKEKYFETAQLYHQEFKESYSLNLDISTFW